ncbi:MAG: hypothetical protein HY220_01685 [Candidatus Sungbacteria bacterium]|uniref:Prepilin-type N-terminal cleavage/methylation domain-containing protein n=1 Tax=Candidatus Sungiibacteriota bacterium TaxID=2750080 RepID=A0A9D6QRX0_9BACT|nr:hypothetical protein [Candidatus Sungbacteria bacterium]
MTKRLCKRPFVYFANIRILASSQGFTLAEMVIILAIITFISAILLAAFPGFNESATMYRSQQELALNIRKAQNTALSVAQVSIIDTANGNAVRNIIPTYVGLHFDNASPTQYFVYAQNPSQNCANQDCRIGDIITFARGITFLQPYPFVGSNGSQPAMIDILFSAPQADVTLSPNGGNSITSYAISLKSPSLNITKTVTVWLSGQIALN